MKLIYLIFAVLLVFTSCEKDELLTLQGTWVLVDGYVYVENMETYSKTKFHHFGDGKTVSQLTYCDPYVFDIENIQIGDSATTWEFCTNGDFILNGDYNHPMYLNITGGYKTIIEHPDFRYTEAGIHPLGGSARPFDSYTYDYEAKLMKVSIQNQTGTNKGYNIEWDNELIFRKISE